MLLLSRICIGNPGGGQVFRDVVPERDAPTHLDCGGSDDDHAPGHQQDLSAVRGCLLHRAHPHISSVARLLLHSTIPIPSQQRQNQGTFPRLVVLHRNKVLKLVFTGNITVESA